MLTSWPASPTRQSVSWSNYSRGIGSHTDLTLKQPNLRPSPDAYFLYAGQPVKLIIWAIPISVMALGVAILWEDLRG
ncbi:hypothetical protein ELI44_04715 [Rhizobium ruizarguesonis]|nr:hypothetical protein ELI42_04690 [Rhizobium ruizarguesonis]TAU62441.1 hypothetical protein ELI44_04715 [Rhizobium ruizarguesonis]